MIAAENAVSGGLHVPPAPDDSGIARGAAKVVPLKLRINDTDVSKSIVERMFQMESVGDLRELSRKQQSAISVIAF